MIVDVVKNKERLQDKACKKQEYSRERCKNLPVHKKRPVDYRRKYTTRKNETVLHIMND